MMNYIKTTINADEYKKVSEFSGKYLVRVLPTEEEEGLVSCFECVVNEEPTDAELLRIEGEIRLSELNNAKALLIGDISAYDKSPEVNSFVLGEQFVSWSDEDDSTPNKKMRMGVRNGVNSCIALGKETYPLWLIGQCFQIPCQSLINILDALEVYALTCFDVTAQHKANVMALDSIEAVKAYDFTAGYPDKLHFEV